MNRIFDNDEHSEAVPPLWRSNRGIGIGLTVAFLTLLVYLFSSEWVYLRLRDGFYLGAFPVAGAVAMLLCAILLIFDRYHREVPERLMDLRWSDWLKVVALLLAAWLLFALASRTSTLLAAPVFLLILMYIFGVRPWTTAVVLALVMGGSVYVVFSLLGIELPHGALPY